MESFWVTKIIQIVSHVTVAHEWKAVLRFDICHTRMSYMGNNSNVSQTVASVNDHEFDREAIIAFRTIL